MTARHVADIRTSRQRLLDAGARTQQDVRDVGDADGHVIGLIQPA